MSRIGSPSAICTASPLATRLMKPATRSGRLVVPELAALPLGEDVPDEGRGELVLGACSVKLAEVRIRTELPADLEEDPEPRGILGRDLA